MGVLSITERIPKLKVKTLKANVTFLTKESESKLILVIQQYFPIVFIVMSHVRDIEIVLGSRVMIRFLFASLVKRNMANSVMKNAAPHTLS